MMFMKVNNNSIGLVSDRLSFGEFQEIEDFVHPQKKEKERKALSERNTKASHRFRHS